MRIKAVLFDFGDTLVLLDQWDYEKCLRRLHDSLQQDRIAISFKEFSPKYFEVRDRLYREAEETLRETDFCFRIAEILRELGFSINKDNPLIIRAAEAFTDCFAQTLRMEPCVPSLLEELRQKYKLGLVSNFAYPPGITKGLERFNLAKFFDAIIISGAVGWRKPNPIIFQKALDALNVKAEETVFVGDEVSTDIEGAKAMGMKTILAKASGNEIEPKPWTILAKAKSGKKVTFVEKADKTIKALDILPSILANWE